MLGELLLKTLLCVLANPPVTSGARTMRRVELAGEKLLYDNRHSDQAGGGHETPAGESPDASETKPADAQNGAGQSGDTQTMPGMQHDGHTMPGMDHGTGSDPAPAQSNSN